MRGLSEAFIEDLLSGQLVLLLEAVKKDDTLCMEIRENYINVYYRGGNLLKVSAASEGKYLYQFDHHYFTQNRNTGAVRYLLPSLGPAENWVQLFPQLKAEMDFWFYEHPMAMREKQQQILRDNNSGYGGRDTDYYIVDLEYANLENGSKFDMLAARWYEKSDIKDIRLALIQVKDGDHLMSCGSEGPGSGIRGSLLDFESFLAKKPAWDLANDIFTEARIVLGQKIKIGLIDGISENAFSKYFDLARIQKVECILIFCNHKPKTGVIGCEFREFMETPQYTRLSEIADIRIAQASFMGYGLYVEQMVAPEKIAKL